MRTPVLASAILLFAALSASAQMPSREFPLELPSGAKLHAEFRKGHLQFCLRELALYEKSTADPEAARPAAKKFLRSAISRFSKQLESEDPPAADWRKLPELGAAAMRTGSTDPLVAAHYIDALLASGQTDEAVKLYQPMGVAFDKSKYPSGMRLLMLLRGKQISDRVGDPKATELIQREVHTAAPAWFDYALESKDGQRHAWSIYEQALGDAPGDAMAAAVAAYEASVLRDDWLWHMQTGRFHADKAWQVRGQTPSHTLELATWQEYADHVRQAGEHYRRAFALRPDLPEAATAMIGVAQQGHDDDSTWDWFHRAIAAEADHMPAYEAALKSLRRRWGGSVGEMLEFGEACVRTGRFDTEIPYAFVLAAHGAHTETGDWGQVFAEPRLYDKLAFVLTRLVDHPSRAGRDELSYAQAELLSQQLCFAATDDRFADATRLWDRLGDRASPEWLAMFALSEGYARSRIAAYTAHGDKLLALRPLTIPPRNDAANARKLLAGYQALAKANREPKAELYLRKWVELAQMEVDYHAGKWVDLTFDEGLNQWIGDTTAWKTEDKSTVFASNVTTGEPLWLYHQGEFPGPKEMAGEVEIVRSLSPGLMLGFYIGMLHHPQPGGRLFGIDPGRGHVAVGTPHVPIEAATFDHETPRKLHVKAWGPEHFDLYIDGRRFRSVSSDEKFHMRENCVGIGTLWWARMSGEIRFKNLRVRKLVQPPPPEFAAHAARVIYFTAAIEREPELTDHVLDRAIAHYHSGHAEQAIADFEAGLAKTPDLHQMRVFLGEMYAETGHSKRAIDELELAVDKSRGPPSHAPRTLAYVLASAADDTLRDGTRALALAKEAVATEQGKDSVGLVALACAHAEAGSFDEALAALDAAQKQQPDARGARQIGELRAKFQERQPHRLPAAKEE
jgi:tetratricopeptide (TPR) repeat protein